MSREFADGNASFSSNGAASHVMVFVSTGFEDKVRAIRRRKQRIDCPDDPDILFEEM
jgi:hypothetical protein